LPRCGAARKQNWVDNGNRCKHRPASKQTGHPDSVICFYSGHGVKLDDQLYLVPTDAYAADEADALLSIERVKEILAKSEARQKLIVLDCCYSGPDTSGFKTVPVDISNNFLEKYLAETKGSVVLSSSAGDQLSWAKSPDSKLSLFQVPAKS